MVAPGMPKSRGRLAMLAAVALAGAGCGGERQDANAPSGDFDVDVTGATFPARQRIAEPSTLKLDVTNRGDRAVPNLAVTVETAPRRRGDAPLAFGQAADDPALADTAQPIWVVDAGPVRGDTAYDNTWAVGELGAGEKRTLEWRLTAMRPGRYTVGWRLAPALVGGARATGERTRGEFDVTIGDRPVSARVNGEGEVERGD
jgi:hypothetical protein